jgi:hypothetical protein
LTYLLIPLNIDCVIGDCLCNAEIDDLQSTFDQNKICGLEIGMHYILLMHGLNSLQHLRCEIRLSSVLTCCQYSPTKFIFSGLPLCSSSNIAKSISPHSITWLISHR